MNIHDELSSIPEPERKNFISLGVKASYAADKWLPDTASGFFGIRIILEGEVEVCAIREWRRTPIQRYGKNEALGIRVVMRPEAEPKLAWRAVSAVKCLEFDGTAVRALIRQPGSALRAIFEHAAHVRDLDITLALHPLFRTLPLLGRQTLLDQAHPLALSPFEPLPETSRKTLYFVTQGALRNKGNVNLAKTAGEALYTASGNEWITESWSELLVFDARHLAAAAEKFPLFADQLRMEL